MFFGIGAFLLFLIAVGVLTHKRHPMLAAMWLFLYGCLPMLRYVLADIPIYWSDVAAVGLFISAMRGRRVERLPPGSLRVLGLLLIGALSMGVLSSVARYGAPIKPTYVLLRHVVALVPIFALPRPSDNPRFYKYLSGAVCVSAVFSLALAIVQVASLQGALWIEQFFYSALSAGAEVNAAGETYRERLLFVLSNTRAYGTHSAATTYAGICVMFACMATLLRLVVPANLRRLLSLAILAFAVTTMLTFSRHGVLAIVVFYAVANLSRRARQTQAIQTILVLGAVFISFTTMSFWQERVNRGGVEEDRNLRLRLIERPLELLDRLSTDPSIAVIGAGLGLRRLFGTGSDELYGFVSNGFLLYFFHCGIGALLMICLLFFKAAQRARQLSGQYSSVALAAIVATAVIIASDNYGFIQLTCPAFWACMLAIIYMLPLKVAAPSVARPAAARQALAGPRPAPRPLPQLRTNQ